MLICSKIPYDSRRDALSALRAISRAYARRGLRGLQGAYLCNPCQRWHLTSAKGVQTAPRMKGPAR
jgi:hypothetical protein